MAKDGTVSEDKPRQVAAWLGGLTERLRRQGESLRLSLTAADGEVLADRTAWAGAAQALTDAAQGAVRLEVSVPEPAEGLLHMAVNELVKQGLRFLQLNYETEATED